MSTACMRWSDGRVQSWKRPEDGGFDPARYGVTEISELEAKAYVLGHHYSGSYPAASQRYGLVDLTTGKLAGVAVLSVPAQARVLTGVFPDLEPYVQSLELGRFVLDDDVAANGESWFLGQVCRMAAERGTRGLVSFSDPLPRQIADGTVIMPGHVGTIYQASNAVYTGRGTARTPTVLRDATVFSDRAAQKVRAQAKGTSTPSSSWLREVRGSAGPVSPRPPGWPRPWTTSVRTRFATEATTGTRSSSGRPAASARAWPSRCPAAATRRPRIGWLPD